MSVPGATLLLAGGTVGAGIIALPAKTYTAGFVPSMVGLVAIWFLLYVSALLLLEVALWYGEDANVPTMAEDTLGKAAKTLCTVVYLIVFGATMVAYIAEAPNFVVPAVEDFTGIQVPDWFAAAGFTLVWGFIIYLGSKQVNRANTWCMIGCIIAYILLLVLGGKRLTQDSLNESNWAIAPRNLPLMVTALSFHNMVPSLKKTMGTPAEIRRAILYGSLLPLVMYIFWEMVILGSLQKGEQIESVMQVVSGLKAVGGQPVVFTFQWFSFLAIITSFLGVGMGCLDFIKDLLLGLKINYLSEMLTPASNKLHPKTNSSLDTSRGIPLIILLIPAYFTALVYPNIFLPALEFSGTLRLLIFSIMPVGMVWIGRYRQNRRPSTPGGKWLLGFVLIASCSLILEEWRHKL